MRRRKANTAGGEGTRTVLQRESDRDVRQGAGDRSDELYDAKEAG